MEFSIKQGSAEKLKSACLVVGVFETDGALQASASLGKQADTQLAALLKQGDVKGKTGASLWLPLPPAGCAAERLLLVGLGKAEAFDEKAYRDAVRLAGKLLQDAAVDSADLTLCNLKVGKHSLAWRVRQAVVALEESAYRFERFKTTPPPAATASKTIHLLLDKKADPSEAAQALCEGVEIAAGMALCKTLANLPANVCTPGLLASEAQAMAKTYKLRSTVLERADLQKLGMGSFLAVAQGATEPPKFIVLEYKGGKKSERPVVLVGKGITFDTGGISLKPGEGMDEMKYDMCGAASVLGTMRAVAGMQLPLNLVVIVPATENMPAGNATRPGDIVTSMSGQTIEILNTDAEGRLILCDALTYAERFDPALVIDVATLTGACVIALGHATSGLFANQDELAAQLLAAGQIAGDRAWQLPLFDVYQDQLKSNFADMANIGGRPAGSITAACFLSRFAKQYNWAHLDIAGTAWKSGADKGATGRPVPLLTHFLLERAGRL